MPALETQSFLDRVVVQLPDLDRARVRQGTHAVLLHLRRLLPMEAEERLLEALPAEARDVSATHEIENERKRGWRHLELSDTHIFFEQVREEGGLPDRKTAIAVAHATLGVTAACLSSPDALYVRSQLPEDFSMLWMESVRASEIPSEGMVRFREAVGHHWTPSDDDELFFTAVRAALDGFLHRLGADLQRKLRPHLPEMVRIRLHTYHPPPDASPARKKPSVRDIVAVVHRVTGLDEATSEQILLGTVRGVKVVRPRHLADPTGMLPRDWEMVWLKA